MRKFYVYEWYVVDIDEVIYVGKGTGNRYKQTNRNKYTIMFKSYKIEERCYFIEKV